LPGTGAAACRSLDLQLAQRLDLAARCFAE